MMNWIKMMGNNGRERRSSGSEISSYNNHENGGGCGWGLVHIIKHHHWPHFMRRLTHHKRKRLVENRTNSISRDGMQELDKLIAEEETIELAPQKNNSIKSRMKAILAEEIYKVKGRHHQSSSKRDKISAAAINPNPREEPIASDGNFADYSKQETVDEHQKRLSKNNTPRQEKLDDTDELMKLKPVSTKKNIADSFLSHPKEYLDALNIISANEEFLVKVLHDPGSPLAHHFRNQQALNRKQGLAKSETFPPPSSSGGRVTKPSRFKQMPRAESGVKGMAEASHNNPCLDSPNKQKNHGETRVVAKRFKDFKQKIKHMIRERRKEMHRVAMDAFIHKIPCDQKIKIDGNQLKNLETCDGQGKDSPGSGYESDCSVPSFGKNKRRLRHMTRASSLNESMDRYCQLYETSFNREIKHQTSFDGVRRMEVVPKQLTRIYSLPDLKSYLNPSEESSDDFSVGMATRGDVKRLVQMGRSFDEHTNEDFSKDQLQTDFPMECIVEEDPTEVIAINSATENEVTVISMENNETTTLSIDDAMESIIEEDPIELTAINSATENEFVLTSTANNNEEKIQCSSDMNESEEAESDTGPALLIDELVKQEEIPDKHLTCDISNLQVKAKDRAEFSYVKDILELSGFSGDGLLGTWHSDDQPLNPLVYEEAKGCLVFDPDCCGNESGGKCDHPLLFDLINEVLMEIYARSYSYYPFPLSHLSHISPMPIGQHVLREVWGLISWYLSLRNEVDQTLGQVVGSDLAKGGWWMNLQFDCECVGLELEDLIFEDLLEEIIWA